LRSVAVFGSSLPREGSPAYEDAREVGREIARRGARVVCGGYGGVMEAASRGAAETGGRSLGVLLGRGEGNRYLTEEVRVPDLSARLRLLRDESDGWIFLPHGLGTMLELVWIAESLVKGDVAPKPFVLLGDFWRPTVDTALAEASNPSGAEVLRRCLHFASSPAQAAASALPADSSRA
jgi:uncharacterized protein (TIGR00730 family)